MRQQGPQGTAQSPSDSSEPRWLQVARGCAVVVFVALPVFAFFSQHYAGRIVWTVAVAGLPLLIVALGYHHWRRICPLAWFSQLAARLGHSGQRRASARLQAGYYYVSFSLFVASLWLRLIATNGDGVALAAFWLLLSLGALVFGAMYTGKSWCNYVCPVSFIEKIYTEPRGLRPTANSQCVKCTACKPACPDINQENGYWKDILSAPKRFVYFSFPGVVFSFYLYFYLQSGSWDYYFSGAWTNEPGLLGRAFLPGYDAKTAGWFFLPVMPRAVAALATLLAGALASYALFAAVERLVARRQRQSQSEEVDAAGVRHIMFTCAAFLAFITFYSFAGAPTILLVPGARHLTQILFVGVATLFLVRRFSRRHAAFAEETLARQIIRRWEWQDMVPPKDLHEAFLIHTIRSQTHASGYARLLDIYRDAVRESVASGLVSRGDVQRLESLRAQLQISQADHEKVMADLAEEDRARILNPALDLSAEKRLQLDTYGSALRNYLESVAAAAGSPDDASIRHLRQEYGVTPEEHAAVLDDLLGRGEGFAAIVARALEVMESALQTIRLVGQSPSEAGSLLIETLSRRRMRAAEGLMRGFGSAGEEQDTTLRDRLLADDDATRERAVEELGGKAGDVAANLLKRERRAAAQKASQHTTLAASVQPHLASADPYVRAAALYQLGELGGVDEDTLQGLMQDEHELVSETAICLLLRSKQLESRAEAGLVTVERMIALRSVPLFSSLPPEDLAGLARASIERTFVPGETLCDEGEDGDEVFILMSGEAAVLLQDGSEQKLVGHEKAGGFIGELALLDPGPRPATVVAGDEGAHALCLGGDSFREVLRSNPSVVGGVIRALVARIRGVQLGPRKVVAGGAQSESSAAAKR